MLVCIKTRNAIKISVVKWWDLNFGNFGIINLKVRKMGHAYSVSYQEVQEFVDSKLLQGRYKMQRKSFRAGLRLLEEPTLLNMETSSNS